MKKFITFFSFIALTVIAVSFTSCSKDEDEPEEPKPEYVKSGGFKVAVTDKIFDYCDIEVVVKYDNETKTYKLDNNTKVTDTGISSVPESSEPAAGRSKEESFTYKNGRINLDLTYTIHEEGKKKMEAASERDSIPYALSITLKSGSETKTTKKYLSSFVKSLEEEIKTAVNNKTLHFEL